MSSPQAAPTSPTEPARAPVTEAQTSGDARSDRFADVEHLGYEQARDQLVEVVRRLEAGAATLEESLELWERGEALAARCEAWLAGARARVEAAGAGSAT